MSFVGISTDTIRSLFTLVRSGKRYYSYHVREVYSDGHNAVESYRADLLIDMSDSKFTSMGFAVYGGEIEPMYVCGDELSYPVAKILAVLLNLLYTV